jgi:ABC-type antimicrobial peptide transport system permease subunit
MFSSFIKTAIRFLWRNKTYSILNFLCLTFGLTCSILAFLHITNILSYDKFHKNYDRLYTVEANVTYFNGDRFPKEVMSASLSETLGKIPEIESLTRVIIRSNIFVNDTVSFNEAGIYADDNFLDVFTFPLKAGNKSDALSDANSIVISEKMAVKFFGSADCIGKSLIMRNDDHEEAYIVKGIFKRNPSPSYLQFEYLIPFSKFISKNEWANEAGASVCQIWALLSPKTDKKLVDSKIRDLIKTREATLNQELFLFPLKEKILYYYIGGRRVWKEMQYLVLAGSIGFAILLIACFNFINLAIAMNIRRYREAGIRKVVGAGRQSIVFQYLGETFILTLISLLVSIDLAGSLVSGFNSMFGSDVNVNLSDYRMLIFFTLTAIFTGLVSGLLPGLYLSSSNPLNILKGKAVTANSFSKFRQSLIIFQFTIPIILIIFMFIIKAQDSYIRNFDLGFDKEKLVIINNTARIEEHKEGVESEILSLPGVKSISFSDCFPVNGATVTNEVNWEGKDPAKKLHFWCLNTDFGFANTVSLKITRGRYFDRSFISDSSCYVINDIAANVMDYADPVGHQIELDGRKGTIIGVFRDYHTIDLSGPFTPTIITLYKGNSKYLLIKYSESDYKELKDKIGELLKRYDPEIEYNPLTFADMRKRTELTTTSNLIGVAFIIAILLACMGLSGLASFNAESRTKEIGIRKVNGGTTASVIRLLGRNYTKWIIIASLFALPVVFLLGNVFLRRFNFRISFPLWTLIAGPALSYLIAVSAVILQSWKAASKNPVEALRYE